MKNNLGDFYDEPDETQGQSLRATATYPTEGEFINKQTAQFNAAFCF